ncbi:extracellular solute-binding protein [Chengkuizengella axinellae]|uniref:Extracellular solute-binding protein n=1 Tax=Chengkuizengella axinellae TaxID=3064388 RepID=A0ABT9IUK5_9BACL|nr:extracellular solute-binding protein [Chengkuizengella sp. 2205SS18-9]MDP5273041.1 extracellular solute-binding protein [Chengkuizengella sp. 2205SS18-9]
MKKVSVFVIIFMFIFALAGCSNSNGDEADNGVKTSDKPSDSNTADATEVQTENSLEGLTLTVGRWGGNDAETAAFQQMVDEFTASTGVEVQEKVYSDYNTELQAELIGGTAPDVFYVDAYMAPFYIQQGVLLPLDEDEFELDQFYEPLKNAFNKDGNYYAISKDYSTLALYYNKKWVNEDDVPATLEEIWNGEFLTNLQSQLSDGAAAMTYNQDLARNMFYAESGGISVIRDDIYSNLSDAQLVNNLTPLYDAAIAKKIVTPQDLGFGWNGDAFGNEKTALMIEGNWVLGFLEQNFPDVEFGVVETPTFSGEKGTMVFTVGYGINANTKEEAAAKVFIKFATGTKGMATWTTGAGVLPSRMDVTEATNVESDPLKVPHIAGAAYATPWQKGTTMDTINNEYRNYAPSVVSGERTLDEALKKAEDEANSIIEAN